MPVRTIPKSHRSLTGQVASRSQSRPIAVESSLERDFALLQLFDPQVASIEEQPVRIDYRLPSGRSGHYTPDFLVSHRIGGRPSRLVEVKYQAELDRKAERYAARFEAARIFAAERGWVFEVVTEVAIRTPYLENARFLLPYRTRRVAPDLRARIVNGLTRMGAATVADLIEKARFINDMERADGLACVWHLLGVGCVFSDLRQPLNMTSVLCLAEETAHAR